MNESAPDPKGRQRFRTNLIRVMSVQVIDDTLLYLLQRDSTV